MPDFHSRVRIKQVNLAIMMPPLIETLASFMRLRRLVY